MARVGIDCDGVLAHFTKRFVEVVNSLWPGKLPEGYEPVTWDYTEVLTKKEMSRAFKRVRETENFWLGLDAHADAVGDLATWFITQKDQEVWVVTSRADTNGMSATWQTEQWLRACGLSPGHNFLGVITVPSSEDKFDILTRLDIRWMIDDKAETIEHMEQFPYMGAALMDQPWNRKSTAKWRAKRLRDFLEAVDAQREHSVHGKSGTHTAGVDSSPRAGETGQQSYARAFARRDR